MSYGYPLGGYSAGYRLRSPATDGENQQLANCGNVVKIENLNINYGGNQVVRAKNSKVKTSGPGCRNDEGYGRGRRESVRRLEYSESRRSDGLAGGHYGRGRLANGDGGLGLDRGREYGRGSAANDFLGPALGDRSRPRCEDSYIPGAGTSMLVNPSRRPRLSDASFHYIDSVVGGRLSGRGGLSRKAGYSDLKAVHFDSYDPYRGGTDVGGRPYGLGDSCPLPRTMRGSEMVGRWDAGSRARAPSLPPGPIGWEFVDVRNVDRGRGRSRRRAGSVVSGWAGGARTKSHIGETRMIEYAPALPAPSRARSEMSKKMSAWQKLDPRTASRSVAGESEYDTTSSMRLASDWAPSSAFPSMMKESRAPVSTFVSRAPSAAASEAPTSSRHSHHSRHSVRAEYSRHERVSRHVRHYGPEERRGREQVREMDDYPTAHPKTQGTRAWEGLERRRGGRDSMPPLNKAMLKALKGEGGKKERSRSMGGRKDGWGKYEWVRKRV